LLIEGRLAAQCPCRQGDYGVDAGARGIAAFKCLNSIDLISDEQLWQRGFYHPVTDSAQREMPIVGAPWRMSVTSPSVAHAAPRLGEHNDYVLGELLGLSESERRRLVEEKVVY
jgi:crotonobetainyl-CoA:carnitine CoA-transferase CaiB-like acyl-CoA transferase